MAALAPVPPKVLKRLLELDGFTVDHEDDYAWSLTKPGIDEVIVLPKYGRVLSMDAHMSTIDKAKIDNARYFQLIDQARYDCGAL